MSKRMTIRLVDELANQVAEIAKKRGISSNSLISEMAWDFVESWKSARKTNKPKQQQS